MITYTHSHVQVYRQVLVRTRDTNEHVHRTWQDSRKVELNRTAVKRRCVRYTYSEYNSDPTVRAQHRGCNKIWMQMQKLSEK